MDPNIQRHDSLLLITSPIVKLKCKIEIGETKNAKMHRFGGVSTPERD